jgi:transglutaminase-like putative cysteine protease
MKTPPLLVGSAILFWGIEVRQLVLAALMALAVEASRLVKQRWDFKETDFKRVSALCTLGLISLTLYRLITGWFNHSAWMIFKWLPVILLPIFLAQIYSSAGRINPKTLFLLRRNKSQTHPPNPRSVDLSYVYMAVCVFSAGFANVRTDLFYIGMLGLAAWAMWFSRPMMGSRRIWIALLLCAAAIGYVGQIGLSQLQAIVEQRTTNWFFQLNPPNKGAYRKYTQIGDIANEKLSNRIVFRTRTGGWDERSLLLREATYDTFRSDLSIWSVSRKGFRRLHESARKASWRLAPAKSAIKICTVAQNMRGSHELLKLPNGAFQVDSLEVHKAEKNDYGAVKVDGDGLVVYHTQYGPGTPLISPPGTQDLKIPTRESKAITRIADQLNLQSLPKAEILKRVKLFFATQFTYALKQKAKQKNMTVIQNFLLNTRSGHCEFFAAATVLLLRHAGIPARYARGYAVDPSDKMDGWNLVRARYAHAWAVAYVDDAWVNLDTTPGTWQQIEREQEPFWQKYWQKIKDFVSAVMFRLAQWRKTLPAEGLTKYFPLLLLPLFMWVGWRITVKLIKARKATQPKEKKMQTAKKKHGSDSCFYRVEKRINNLGVPRHQWETLSAWLNRVESKLNPAVSLDIPRKLLSLHYRYRFDPQGLPPSEKSQMESMTAQWLQHNDASPSDDMRPIS